jgi:hypothetical protein
MLPGVHAFGVARIADDHADAMIVLLGTHRERPRGRRTAQERDELASSHLPPSFRGIVSVQILEVLDDVRFIPLWANGGHSFGYSITSSARAISVGAMDSPALWRS